MRLVVACAAPLFCFVVRGAAEEGQLRPVTRGNQLDMLGPSGETLFWANSNGKLFSTEALALQESYTGWLQGRFGGFGGSLGLPMGAHGRIMIVSQRDPGRGISASPDRFVIPTLNDAAGSLTRDTLAVPFYVLGAQVVSLWDSLEQDCEKVRKAAPREGPSSCDRYHWNLAAAAGGGSIEFDRKDPYYLDFRLARLLAATRELGNWDALLKGMPDEVALNSDVTRAMRARERSLRDAAKLASDAAELTSWSLDELSHRGEAQ